MTVVTCRRGLRVAPSPGGISCWWRMARQTRYSPELADAIVGSLAGGVPKKFAAESNGVSYDALNDWENGRGGIPKAEAGQFRQAIMRAAAQGVATRIKRIGQSGAAGDWKADAWYLEHVHSEVFSPRSQTDSTVSGKDGAAILVSIVAREDGPK